MPWGMDDVFNLINNYRQFECLWNFQSPTYKRTDLKKTAWQQLAVKSGHDVSEVKKKVKHLRTAYIVEKKKVDEKKRAGEIGYRPHLYYFQELTFLNPVIVLRQTKGTFEEDDAAEPNDTDYNETIIKHDLNSGEEHVPFRTERRSSSSSSSQPKSLPLPAVAKKKKVSKQTKLDKYDSAINEIVNYAKSENQNNVYTTFAKAIAMQLQQMTPAEAAETMGEIQQLISQHVVRSIISKEQGQQQKSTLPATRASSELEKATSAPNGSNDLNKLRSELKTAEERWKTLHDNYNRELEKQKHSDQLVNDLESAWEQSKRIELPSQCPEPATNQESYDEEGFISEDPLYFDEDENSSFQESDSNPSISSGLGQSVDNPRKRKLDMLRSGSMDSGNRGFFNKELRLKLKKLPTRRKNKSRMEISREYDEEEDEYLEDE